VLAACRAPSPALEALGVQVIAGIEVTSDEGVAGLADAIAGEQIDLVIPAAGISVPVAGLAELDTALMAQEYETNALGAVRVVRAALPRMRDGGKIALISTGMGASVTNNTPRASGHGYRMSKGALNVFGAILATEVAPRSISVVVLGPGPVDTDMLRHAAAKGTSLRSLDEAATPAEAAQGLLDRIDELTLETSGRWIDRAGQPYG
jgi:NAD(P)-dependent dehydrogenase (short-subunit alcohol dehydrogenase family)